MLGAWKTTENVQEQKVPEFYKRFVHHIASWSARVILLALVMLAPWFYAGAQWQFQIWLVFGGLLLTTLTSLAIWTSPQKHPACVSIIYWLVGLLGISFAQQIPLPKFLASYASVSSRIVESAMDEAHQISNRTPETIDQTFWLANDLHRTLSIVPEQTRASMAVLSVAIVTIWSASVLFVSARWAVILAVAIGACGLANAFLGLVQTVSWNNWTLLDMPLKTYFSTFVSRNSAPAFFASATGSLCALLGIAFRNNKRKRREEYRVTYPSQSWHGRLRSRMEDVFIDLDTIAIVCISCVAFMLVATLATASRSGVIACFGACFVTLSLMIGARGGLTRALTIATVLALVVIGMLSFYELDASLLERMEQLNSQVHSGSDGRLILWGFTLHSLKWYWMFGSGLGTYRFAILPFHDHGPTNVWFHHAENFPLEIAAELGLPGLIVSIAVFALVLMQIRRQSYAREEGLLLAAVLFSTSALAFQALFDFSLILPGVFLPYAALMGAFLGRCQLIKSDAVRLRELGDASRDARKLAKLPKSPERWYRSHWVGHGMVAFACIVASLMGIQSLFAAAIAERLESVVNIEEEAVGKRAIHTDFFSRILTSAARYAGYPEVELQTARALRLLWSASALENIEWEPERSKEPTVDLETRLKLTTPSAMRKALNDPSGPIDLWLRSALLKDTAGIGLAQQSFDHFTNAARRNPLDTRALWGSVRGDFGWLSPFSRTAMRALLRKFGSNNPGMLANAGVAAIRSGSLDEGRLLLKRAMELDQFQSEKLAVLLDKISVAELLDLLPEDPVALARTARSLSLAKNWEHFEAEVLKRASFQVAKASGKALEEWLNLAWVAEKVGDSSTRISKLRGALGLAPGRSDVRYQLALELKKGGQLKEAINELKKISRLGSNQYEEVLKEWQSLDQ